MSYQDGIIAATEKAIEDIFRSAKAMPTDKLEWSPLEQGRSALSMLQECAQSPSWFIPMVVDKKFPDISPEAMEQGRKQREQFKTIDDCEAACKEGSARLFDAMRAVPESDLCIMIHLPFGGGMDMPLSAVMTMHYWNLVYHLGQVNYIQTLYGDKDMH